ncbi:hypothetical protein COSO111634_32870 [Corallococcus soli]
MEHVAGTNRAANTDDPKARLTKFTKRDTQV